MASCSNEHNNKSGEKQWRAMVVKTRPVQAQAVATDYNTNLQAVLREGNVFAFRQFLQQTGRSLPDEMMADTLKLQTVMHQLRLYEPELADLHATSRAWLEANTGLQPFGLSLSEASTISPEDKLAQFRAALHGSSPMVGTDILELYKALDGEGKERRTIILKQKKSPPSE